VVEEPSDVKSCLSNAKIHQDDRIDKKRWSERTKTVYIVPPSVRQVCVVATLHVAKAVHY
jgi:hypothetical protein